MKLAQYKDRKSGKLISLIQQEVIDFNQGKSTSVSQEDYQRVINMIHYICKHGNSYEDGIHEILRIQKECKEIYQRIYSMYLQKYNEQLEDVLCRQIPNIFASWKNRISWCETDENLDYPLNDGLPLYHDMYGLVGVDLVLYYLKRLEEELSFVALYKDELDEFVEYLDAYTKSSWNMYNLISNQLYANQILKNKKSILLSQEDYVIFQKRNTKQIPVFYQKRTKINHLIQFQDSYSDIDFNSFFESLNNLTLDEKINCILHHSLSIHDVLDLLDHEVFYNDEYAYFFKQLDVYTLALLYRYCEEKCKKYFESLDNFEQIIELSNQVSLH